MWGVLKQNLSYSIRTLLKNKGFTVTAVLTLALGIGATTAIFSVVHAVFEPMPYPKPDQLVMVWSKARAGRNSVEAGGLQPLTDRNRLRAHNAHRDSSIWRVCRCCSGAISFLTKISRARTV